MILVFALGARVPALTGGIVGGNALIGAAGLLVGLAAALWATRLLSGFLFGVQPLDPVTWGAVAVLLFGAILTASWLAARRIGRLDPVAVLRTE